MLLQELMRKRSALSDTDRAIANYLLVQREKSAHISARQVARDVHTSASTVVRFCQRFGYSGYDAFREAFLSELHYLTSHFDGVDPNYPFGFGERRSVVAAKMGTRYREIIDETLHFASEDLLDRAVALLDSARTIIVYSTGVQADVAEEFRDKMLKIGRDVVIERRSNTAFYRAAHANPADTAIIAMSYSGETNHLVRVVKKAHERKVPLIAITSYGGNTLSGLADVVLYVSTREKLDSNIGHFSMNVSSMLLLDILYACMFNENYYVNFESRLEMRREFEDFRQSRNPLIADLPESGALH